MSKSPPQQPTNGEMVAAALNEQGYLFAQVIREKILYDHPGKGKPQKEWIYAAGEYPVTASDGSQTRIDLVLRHIKNRGVHLCVECKRANPLYKQWIFFDPQSDSNDNSKSTFHFDTFHVHQRPIKPSDWIVSGLTTKPKPSSCQLFELYTEVAVNREKRASHTETMEEAFRQVVAGQTGLIAKQIGFDDGFFVTAVPVIVTTAVLLHADFDVKKASLNFGTIDPEHLALHPLKFCAVNYHADDNVRPKPIHAEHRARTLEEDALYWQQRTVFVVQADAIIDFLQWTAENIK